MASAWHINTTINSPTISKNRLDQILGKQGSKAKDVYASKISLASRVVKVERSVSTENGPMMTLLLALISTLSLRRWPTSKKN